MNNIEILESNVKYFRDVLETKIKKELQEISDKNGLVIDIDIENKVVEVYDKNGKEVFGDIYSNIYDLMSIWWDNIIDYNNFYNLKIKPKN